MTGTEFVAQLIAENEELLARIDAPAESRPSERSDPQSFDTLATLMKMALKNEMEAAEIAAEWVATTPELDAKVALACHAGDEARHYELVEARARSMAIPLDGFHPLDPPSPVLSYLRTLNSTVERVAAALVAREAMGGRRNAQFLAFLEQAGHGELAAFTGRSSIPTKTAIIAMAARCSHASRRLPRPRKRLAAQLGACFETGDRVRTAALRQTGASVIPGC